MVKQYFKMKLLPIICVIMTSSLLLVDPATSSPCSNPIPNLDLDKMIKGVDITEVDQYPMVKPTSQSSKDNILQFTCVRGRTWLDLKSKKEYDFPDQIRFPQSRCVESIHVELVKSTASLPVALSKEEGNYPRYLTFASIHSNTYRKLNEDVSNNDDSTLIVNSIARLQDTDIYFEKIDISPEAQSYITTNLTEPFKSNRDVYLEFVKKYGTHYRANGIFGGAVRNYMEIDTAYSSNVSDSEIEKMAKLHFDEILGYHPNEDVTTSFKDSIKKQNIFYYGGSENLKTSEKVQEWKSSTKQNPWFYSTQLIPIYELVKDDKTKNEIKQAIDYYLIEKTFTANMETYSIYNKVSKDSINDLIYLLTMSKHIDQIVEHNSLFGQIKYQLEVPSWFETNTELCFSTYGGAHCSNETECGLINYRLHSFLEDMGSKPKCQIKWKIKASDPVSQQGLADTKMCMRYESLGGKPCDGNSGVDTCASVNQFPTFADNSTILQGSCKPAWSIKVPDLATVWLKTLRDVMLPLDDDM